MNYENEPLPPEGWCWPGELAARETYVAGTERWPVIPRAAIYAPPPGRPERRRRRLHRTVDALIALCLAAAVVLLIVAAMTASGVD